MSVFDNNITRELTIGQIYDFSVSSTGMSFWNIDKKIQVIFNEEAWGGDPLNACEGIKRRLMRMSVSYLDNPKLYKLIISRLLNPRTRRQTKWGVSIQPNKISMSFYFESKQNRSIQLTIYLNKI